MTTPARPPLIRGSTLPSYLPRTETPGLGLSPQEYTSGPESNTYRRILGSSDVQASTAPNPIPRPHPIITSPSSPSSHSHSPHSPTTQSFMAPSISSPPPSQSRQPSFRSTSHPKPPVTMELETSPTQHVLYAPIGSQFHSECITIASKRGNCLLIVADRWDSEEDCRYEWLVRFDRDADMSAILASFDAGVLKVTVKRLKAPQVQDNA